jgi:gluconokinase
VILILMGVAGSGKSSVGAALAARIGVEFVEGDELHSPASRRKMHEGIALTDEDRWPWLRAIAAAIDAILARAGSAVITCSALKQSYRDLLARPGAQFVYLKVSWSVARARLAARTEHFFAPSLLQSQFDTLEEPHDALVVDADRSVELIVSEVVDRCRGGPQEAACAPGPGLPRKA